MFGVGGGPRVQAAPCINIQKAFTALLRLLISFYSTRTEAATRRRVDHLPCRR